VQCSDCVQAVREEVSRMKNELNML
jgi:hypothetical protein